MEDFSLLQNLTFLNTLKINFLNIFDSLASFYSDFWRFHEIKSTWVQLVIMYPLSYQDIIGYMWFVNITKAQILFVSHAHY